MVEVITEVFNEVYNAIIAVYPNADLANHYVDQPSNFPHVQLWDESNTTGIRGMNLSGDECFSNIVIHFEFFDHLLDGEGADNVDAMIAITDPVMRRLGYRRTYSAPVPNFKNASIYRKVVRYSKLQPN